jgi:hypothetical protein
MIKLDIQLALNTDFTVKDRNTALMIYHALADLLRNKRPQARTLVERKDGIVQIAPPYDEMELGILFITLAHSLGVAMPAEGVVIAEEMASSRQAAKAKVAPRRSKRRRGNSCCAKSRPNKRLMR